MNHLEDLLNNRKVFFNFMYENYKIVQNSNLFYRDLQYAIMAYFKMKDKPVKYAMADMLTKDYLDNLVQNNGLTKIDSKSWKINFEVGIKKKVEEPEGVENE